MNIQKPRPLWQLTFEGAWPTSVAFLGSGRRLAAGNQKGEIYVWDLPESPADGEAPADPKADAKGAATGAAAKPAEKGGDRKPPDHAPARRLDGHSHGVSRLVATRDGRQLVSASLDGTLRLWLPDAPAGGRAEAVLDGDQRKARAKRERKEELLTAPGVNVETLASAHTFEGHAGWVTALGLSDDERTLISGDASSRVIVWSLADRKETIRWSGLPWNVIQSIGLSNDGRTAVVSELTDKRDDFDVPAAALRVWDVAAGAEKLDVLKTLFPKYKRDDSSYGGSQVWRKFVAAGLQGAAVSPDGKWFAVGQGGETGVGKVQLLELETGKLVRELSGHQYGVTDVKFSADGRYVLSAGRDTTLRICQVSDGKELAALGSPRGGQFKDWLSSIAISPDQRRVAASDIAGMVHVWTLE